MTSLQSASVHSLRYPIFFRDHCKAKLAVRGTLEAEFWQFAVNSRQSCRSDKKTWFLLSTVYCSNELKSVLIIPGMDVDQFGSGSIYIGLIRILKRTVVVRGAIFSLGFQLESELWQNRIRDQIFHQWMPYSECCSYKTGDFEMEKRFPS
jgi:hypothetical protein